MSLTEIAEAVAVKVLALDGKAHPFADNLAIQKVILEALKEAEQFGKRNCVHAEAKRWLNGGDLNPAR
jgi:hypothetical protein